MRSVPPALNGECFDYRYGFCIAGPNCQYKHVRRQPEEVDQIRHIPDWYFEKIKSVFAQENVTNYQQIHEFLSLWRQQSADEGPFSIFSGGQSTSRLDASRLQHFNQMSEVSHHTIQSFVMHSLTGFNTSRCSESNNDFSESKYPRERSRW